MLPRGVKGVLSTADKADKQQLLTIEQKSMALENKTQSKDSFTNGSNSAIPKMPSLKPETEFESMMKNKQ